MKEIINGIEVWFWEDNTRVMDSYKYSNVELFEVAYYIVKYRIKNKLPQVRSFKSVYHEILAHKKMYKGHLFRNRTKDTDVETVISKKLEKFYNLIGKC